jgi:hypothetical protein
MIFYLKSRFLAKPCGSERVKEHILMVQLVFQIKGILRGKMHFLDFSQKNVLEELK